jgi:formylglycine-generating enzyme required for sulfatase activity
LYDKDFYQVPREPEENPTGPSKGDYRIVRGGSGASKDSQCTVHYRKDFNKTWSNYAIGFRPVISQPPWNAVPEET